MPERFGKNEATYDALRQQTLALGGSVAVGNGVGVTPGPGIDVVDQQVGLGGDTVLIYHSGGTAVTEYDADGAGVAAAFAAAVAGDTILLPSIPIAVTAALTLPPGAALVGLSKNSVLNFSGFSGAAITLGAGSILTGFSLNFDGTGYATAVGVIAEEDDCVVDDLTIYVHAASNENICIGIGSEPRAIETWGIILSDGIQNNVVWSTFDFETATNDTAWHDLSPLPFNDPDSTLEFGVSRDGTDLFIGLDDVMYRCTNLPAVRAAPATTATWEQILSSSTPIDGKLLFRIIKAVYWNDRICAICRSTATTRYYYGEYVSDAWTWWSLGFDSTAILPVTYLAYALATGAAIDHSTAKNPKSGATYWDIQNSFGQGNAQALWTNHDPADTYALYSVFKRPTYTTKIITVGNENLHDTSSTNANATDVSGSYLGPHVYVTLDDGKLFTSDDGATFTAATSPGIGKVLDHFLFGGGSLVFMNYNAVTSGAVFEVSLDRGDTWHNKTGDLWTAILGNPTNGIIAYQWGLVF